MIKSFPQTSKNSKLLLTNLYTAEENREGKTKQSSLIFFFASFSSFVLCYYIIKIMKSDSTFYNNSGKFIITCLFSFSAFTNSPLFILLRSKSSCSCCSRCSKHTASLACMYPNQLL